MARTSIKSQKSKPRGKKLTYKRKAAATWRRPAPAQVAGGFNPNTPVVTNLKGSSAFKLFASPAPFPSRTKKVLTWRGDPYYATGATTGSYASIAVNNCNDPDYNNGFGNTQPLYWDQLTGVNGPYRSYVVKRWTCTWQLINAAAYEMEVFIDNSLVTTDDDTVAELRTRPTPTRVLLGVNGSEGSRVDIMHSGRAKDYIGFDKDTNQVTAYNASPSQVIYQTILWNNLRGASVYNLIIVPTLMVEVELYNTDATAS